MSTPAVVLLTTLALGAAAWSFARIVRSYRTLRGFPWLLSLAFAAASIVAVFALHALFGR